MTEDRDKELENRRWKEIMDLQKCKEEYAALLVLGGIHLKQGEKVIINSDVLTQEMAHLVMEKCYEYGASKVEIRWKSARADAWDIKKADLDILKTVDPWEEARLDQQTKELPCVIHLLTSEALEYSPEMVERQAEMTKARLPLLLKYNQAMQDKYKWTVGGIPTASWAEKVFPGEENNLQHLWEDVLQTLYINGDGSSIRTWEKKWENAWRHLEALNDLELKTIRLKSGLGTDLTIEMLPGAMWHCGAFKEMGYAANLPSEELYTSPKAGSADGVLAASCPLVYANQYVEGLKLTFSGGRVTKVSAKQGEGFFKNLVETDEGVSRLGEVAIVDKNSPIRRAGHLFYHTLYDENSASHIAIGRGFPFVMKDFQNMSDEERLNCGVNNSGIHCDIMWGTEDAEITGVCQNGEEVVIMKDGSWRY